MKRESSTGLAGSVCGPEQSEVGESREFGFEGGDGFDEAGDGEGVADATLSADQAEYTAFAGELDGDAHERGDAGAVDLRDTVQEDDNFLRAPFDHGFESVVELFGGLADGEAAANVEYRHPAGLADVDFHGRPVSHGSGSIYPHWGAMAICHAARHYTPEGKLHKGNHFRRTCRLLQNTRRETHQKNESRK